MPKNQEAHFITTRTQSLQYSTYPILLVTSQKVKPANPAHYFLILVVIGCIGTRVVLTEVSNSYNFSRVLLT